MFYSGGQGSKYKNPSPVAFSFLTKGLLLHFTVFLKVIQKELASYWSPGHSLAKPAKPAKEKRKILKTRFSQETCLWRRLVGYLSG